jgi:hypothetical protein
MIRFAADEDFNNDVVRALRRALPEVNIVGVRRNLCTLCGSVMSAIRRMRPPQRGHVSTSTAKVLRSSSAQGR